MVSTACEDHTVPGSCVQILDGMVVAFWGPLRNNNYPSYILLMSSASDAVSSPVAPPTVDNDRRRSCTRSALLVRVEVDSARSHQMDSASQRSRSLEVLF